MQSAMGTEAAVATVDCAAAFASSYYSSDEASACAAECAHTQHHTEDDSGEIVGNPFAAPVQGEGKQRIRVEGATTSGGCCDPKVLLTEPQALQQEDEEEEVAEYGCDDDEGDEEEGCEEDECDEEYEEEEDEDDAYNEGEEQEEKCHFEPPGDESQDPQCKKDVFNINGKKYATSALVKNAGFMAAQKRLRGNPKSTFMMCSLLKVHNIIQCRDLHLTNRALLIGDRYVRINMLLDNPARAALLTNPASAVRAAFCAVAADGHDAAACSALHLLPNVVFVGGPEMRVGYFETELHDNLALRRLRADPDSCGRWCKNRRSHVIVKCAFVHYNRGSAYTESPREPSRPLALVPDLRPGPPRPARGGGGRGGFPRGRGGRGRGAGVRAGGRGRGMNRGGVGRGGGAPAANPRVAMATPFADGLMNPGDRQPASSLADVEPLSEEKMQSQKESLLNFMLLFLGLVVVVLAYILS